MNNLNKKFLKTKQLIDSNKFYGIIDCIQTIKAI